MLNHLFGRVFGQFPIADSPRHFCYGFKLKKGFAPRVRSRQRCHFGLQLLD